MPQNHYNFKKKCENPSWHTLLVDETKYWMFVTVGGPEDDVPITNSPIKERKLIRKCEETHNKQVK